jgi:glycosyltransferase involved in cell wall biosynthesis
VALAGALAGAGVAVELHTAADAEALPPGPATVKRHPCLWRFRWVPVRPVRRVAVVLGWLGAGVPSCLARVRRGDVAHVQGLFHSALMVPLVVGLRGRRCTIAFSPHNTFSRSGRRWEQRVLRWLAARADVVVTFSEHDRARVASWGAPAVRAPFPFPCPPAPRPELVARWRRRWLAGGATSVALLPGHLRADKGVDVAVRAAAGWGDDGLVLAVVGEDGGGLEPGRSLARGLGVRVSWDEGYRPFAEFLAALAAADVVVCPYRAGSQSGVLALARAVGRPTVATDVGGLGELATVVVAPDDPRALAEGVRRALAAPPPAAVHDDPAAVARAYASAYGIV